MKYECHFPSQHQKFYHISKAQPKTFSYRHPILVYFKVTTFLGTKKARRAFQLFCFPNSEKSIKHKACVIVNVLLDKHQIVINAEKLNFNWDAKKTQSASPIFLILEVFDLRLSNNKKMSSRISNFCA